MHVDASICEEWISGLGMYSSRRDRKVLEKCSTFEDDYSRRAVPISSRAMMVRRSRERSKSEVYGKEEEFS